MNEVEKYPAFPKIPRLNRNAVITEKLDGTNALVSISQDGVVRAGSRTRWITPEADNYGFARWVEEHKEELAKLGPGNHYGEWWGAGIQRRYGQTGKRFSLFNTGRWNHQGRPACCEIVPVLYYGQFTTNAVDDAVRALKTAGSVAVPGWMQPEGVVVYLVAADSMHKVLCENDNLPKGV